MDEQPPMRILYVEDNPGDAELVRHALLRTAPAFTLELAGTLAAARAALRTRGPFDVVLADLNLPDGNGMDLIAEVRTVALPLALVALTGQGDEALVLAALKAGADDYLAKAEGFEARVALTLRSALRRYRAASERQARALRVLYAEHNALDIDLTRRHLARHAGHIALDCVPDAASVLARLPASPDAPCAVDLLLLDYRLVGDSGLEVLKLLREDRGLDLPVVMVTGQGNEDVAAQAMRLGATDYVVKHDNYLLALPAVLEGAFHRISAAREHAALQRSEERLALVLRGSSDAAWDFDLVDGRHFLSPVLWRLLGWEPELAAREPGLPRALLPADEVPALQRQLQDLLGGSAADFETELRLRHRSGRLVPALARGYVSRDGSGHAIRVSGTVTDLSERKRAEAEIRQLNASLEQKVGQRTAELAAAKEAAEAANRSKSAFLARMSHDLRTPLNAVLGFSQLLALDTSIAASPAAAQQVRHIHAAGTHLLALIDEVLDLARIESGGLHLLNEPVEIGALLAECLTLVAPLATQHKVRTLFTPGPGRYSARGDRTRLRQVLVNLLSNAIKYNHTGGTVDLLVGEVAGQVQVRICDTGIGMDAAQLSALFEPFNRLGREHSGIDGTGLGLTIAKQLVNSMQGNLDVHSQPGLGSTFLLRLPMAGPQPGPQPGLRPTTVPALEVPPAVEAAAPRRVLYVEDNAANALLMQAMLSLRPDLQLEVAVDGPAGLAAALRERPDLVLLDLDLPGMSGHEVLQRLRADARSADIPCVAVSANALSQEIQRAQRAGFADYLTKPFTVTKLFRAIDALDRR